MDAETLRYRLASGELVDLSTSESHVEVDSDLIAQLLTTPVKDTTVPRSVQLEGARIVGALDMRTAALTRGLLLRRCILTEPVVLQDADVLSLKFPGTRIQGLIARGIRCRSSIDLSDDFTAEGEVNLVGARIDGNLNCDKGIFRNRRGVALNAESVTIDGSMFCRNGFKAEGEVNLLGSHVGHLTCSGGMFTNPERVALKADGLKVDNHLFCRNGFHAKGEVRLMGAEIGGQLDCTGAVLANPAGLALNAYGLTVIQDMSCGFCARGEVNFVGARIGGSLDCRGGTFRNRGRIALNAYRLAVGQEMLCGQGFRARGQVVLAGAHIGGNLDCDKGIFRNRRGVALNAEAVTVEGSMFCRHGFKAEGEVNLLGSHVGHLTCSGGMFINPEQVALKGDGLKVDNNMFCRHGFHAKGEVRLVGAQIGGQLDCSGADLSNDSGPALTADGLHVDRNMFLRGEPTTTGCRWLTATGSGDAGAVRLSGARIGELECDKAALRNDSGPALVANSLQVDQSMSLADGFRASSAGDDVTINLTGARVGGTLVFNPGLFEHLTDSHRRLAVDGLTYARVPEQIPTRDWLQLLRYGTRSYAAQPYQQLAAGHRALGNERQVREILMAQRDDQLTRTNPGWRERLWGKITKVTLGYGYQPWRALLFLAGVLALSCVLAVALGSHGALTTTDKTRHQDQPCTVVQKVSVGLDLNLPVGTSVARAKCDLTKNSTSATGAWLTATGWVMRVLAWAFAALFIAGFTSAVRKT
jgi:hypothetical protein